MDYDKLDGLRKSASIDMCLPEVHGGICSQICFESDYFEEFIPLDKSDDGASVSVQIGTYRKALLRIIDTDAKRLKDGDLGFELIIPGEGSPIQERAEALSIWCQGFIDGVSFLLTEHDLKIDQSETKESFEIIEDFTQISTLDSHSISEEVDQELALMELIEFVRLSVQMIYDEFRID
ncbi:MAG: UPF0149 family protein [Gammaproteobacteria bacterium]|jgi:hypothetical protein|nr:hypothetical protein [Gammaproteobacteria bacterium]MBQ09622.1 hypothetical protein [Gammaproteobacteria bacterium]MDP6146950.1 UPF0149 family protein [Gammaproteobacteria bacterium]HJL80605.1 UPF0149 family protein [Gammaproteobacteria bacterium]HJM99926.1 UPF0149 family protein [Gammaproteobacteria bacterium]|tara:strand:+ start:43197 stop:43733 length:537 start_codon:yes stop_codon:yes gene_type:complete